jgi:dihydroorotate dehydrogenase (NAD+) catalytic subunit
VYKYDLSLNPPLMNAAGSLGFAPDPHGPEDLTLLGAFVTNPVSLLPRTPAQERACLPFPGGFLLHTGHPNPGLKAVLRRFAARWERSSIPVIVHVLAQRGGEVHQIMQHLERCEFLAGIEVGIPPEADPDIVLELVGAAQGERPVIARLSLEQAVWLAPFALQAGASAISLGAPRGTLPGPSGKPVRGRLYGPALFPQALEAVRQLVHLGVPVFASGGVYQRWQAEAMLQAGATAVQLDTVLWRGGFE